MQLTFYFEISKEIKLERTVLNVVFKCKKENCFEQKNNHRSLKFCSECGTPIERFEKKVIETKNSIAPYDFCNEYLGNHDERVCSDNGGLPNNIWLWNYSLPTNLKKYEIKSDELDINNNIALDLSEVDIEKAVKEFLQIDKVNELIEKFESVYGKNSIKVKYGIVCPIY